MPFSMNSNGQMHIDFSKVLEKANKGVLRASAFLAFSVNASKREDLNDFQMHDSYIRLVPEILSDAQIEEYKNAYVGWATCNSLRELVESFGLYMNDIYCSSLLMRGITQQELDKLHSEFMQLGEKRRLKKLRQEFSIQSDINGHLDSLIDVRNTITHRWGVASNGAMTAKWKKNRFVVVGDNGEETELQIPVEEPQYIEKGGMMGIQVVDCEKRFELNELVSFTPSEMHEVCLTIQIGVGQIFNSVKEQFPAAIK